MAYIDCVECGQTFRWSEHNHLKRTKPDLCPECREERKIEEHRGDGYS